MVVGTKEIGQRGGFVLYEITGATEQEVRQRGDQFERAWGWGYSPIIMSPRQQSDGSWKAGASRQTTC